ncbi:MAG: hypothetical protein V4692_13985 [Bdellovibrionota bacterium]
MKKLTLVLLSLASVSAQAKPIEIPSEAARIEFIRNGDVWGRPAWVDENFNFDPNFKLSEVHEIKPGKDTILARSKVYCINNGTKLVFNGKTDKFECQLLDQVNGKHIPQVKEKNGKPEDIKVKYNFLDKNGNPDPKADNKEIWSEVLASRVLRAIGFTADKMYFTSVDCFGCSTHPNSDPKQDSTSMVKPRSFSPVAIEDKPKGEEMAFGKIEGFTGGEMNKYFSSDLIKAKKQKEERDALSLMMAFLQHADNKAENQRMLCKETDPTGKICTGKVVLYLQDLGGTFGKGTEGFYPSKVNFDGWKKTPIWKDAANCQASLGKHGSGDKASMDPIVTEEGRALLAKLLGGLTAGPQGRQRIIDLFKSVNIAQRKEKTASAEAWADVFISKVEQIKNARCKLTVHDIIK